MIHCKECVNWKNIREWLGHDFGECNVEDKFLELGMYPEDNPIFKYDFASIYGEKAWEDVNDV